MNKRALSPLTSTFLLLGVSIVIGILVMTWGRSYVEQATVAGEKKIEQQRTESLFQDLDARLQRGEINREQYEKIKAVLLAQNSK
jgi:uncharacterized membrane protein